MSTFGMMLRRFRKTRNMSQEEMAELLGTSKQVISRYENEQRIPKISTAAEYARKLGVPLAVLNGDNLPGDIMRVRTEKMRRVAMLGEIAAGKPMLCEQEFEAYASVGQPDQADYALRINGDSMQPTFLNGDVVYIREQPDVLDGQAAAVIVDDSATLKRVYHQPGGLMLVSDNAAKYPPMFIKCDEHDFVRVLGLAVGFTRIFQN